MIAKPSHPSPQKIAIMGAGVAGISTAWHSLKLMDAETQVHLFEQQDLAQRFNRSLQSQQQHYASSSSYGARSIRLANAKSPEDAKKIAFSSAMVKEIESLASQHGIYEQLIAEGYKDLKEEPLLTGQPYFTVCSYQDSAALKKMQQSIANVTGAPASLALTGIEQEELPYAYIPPTQNNLPEYAAQLQQFQQRYPAYAAPILKEYQLDQLIHRPDFAAQLKQRFDSGKPLPAIFMEREWSPDYPERNAVSVNVNQLTQISIALMQKLYPQRFRLHDGVKIEQTKLAEHTKQHQLHLSNGQQMEGFSDLFLASGPAIAQTLKQTAAAQGIEMGMYAAPYIEFPMPTSTLGGKASGLLKGGLLPKGMDFSLVMPDGKIQPLTVKTVSRNGKWMENGQLLGDRMKLQFGEKIPLEKIQDLQNMPAFDEAAKEMVTKTAEWFGVTLPAASLNQTQARWCPQALAKDTKGQSHFGAKGSLSPQMPPNTHIVGPGNAAGMHMLPGNTLQLVQSVLAHKQQEKAGAAVAF
jgi:hypothetical protein